MCFQMVAEEVAAKSDPPPTYDDVVLAEGSPPPYYAVVSEGTDGGADGGNNSSPTSPAATHGKEGTHDRSVDNQPSERSSSADNRGNPASRRWLCRSGILHSVMLRASKRPTSITCPSQPVKVLGGRTFSLRRSSSTPSLPGLGSRPPLVRCPSTPSLCAPYSCF